MNTLKNTVAQDQETRQQTVMYLLAQGLPLEEACIRANVTMGTFQKWQKQDDNFGRQAKALLSGSKRSGGHSYTVQTAAIAVRSSSDGDDISDVRQADTVDLQFQAGHWKARLAEIDTLGQSDFRIDYESLDFLISENSSIIAEGLRQVIGSIGHPVARQEAHDLYRHWCDIYSRVNNRSDRLHDRHMTCSSEYSVEQNEMFVAHSAVMRSVAVYADDIAQYWWDAAEQSA